MSGEYIKSIILGASKFCSIIFSSPFPIETTKNNCGVSPISVAQKKITHSNIENTRQHI